MQEESPKKLVVICAKRKQLPLIFELELEFDFFARKVAKTQILKLCATNL
jgi:hypothetical protein